jgi:hypothetical protein
MRDEVLARTLAGRLEGTGDPRQTSPVRFSRDGPRRADAAGRAQTLTPGPGPETRREIRSRTTFIRMVSPTLTTIQNRHPPVAQPLPPPPNTMMKRLIIHRIGTISISFLTQSR